MLSELYNYALDHNLAAVPGFKPKKVKAYVLLSAKGELLGIEVRPKDAKDVYAPDIGASANGTRYCNPLIEKGKIPLNQIEDDEKDKNIPTKHEFYLSMLSDGTCYEPSFGIVKAVLEDESERVKIADQLKQSGIKISDPIGFKVDGTPLEKIQYCQQWWAEYRKIFASKPTGNLPRCLITGELAPALDTVPKVQGLFNVGGHSAGDALLCFDKNAFQSYDLKQSANASVSEEAMTAVNAALTQLIADAPTLANAKHIHWYAGVNVADENDIFAAIFNPLLTGNEAAEVDEETEYDDGDGEIRAMRSAKALFEAVEAGKRPELLSARYYIMPLSGNNGRMMVRNWMEGSYEELYRNISQWFDDLCLVTNNGKGRTLPPKLSAIYMRMLKPGGDKSKLFSRIDDELPSLSVRIINAIVTGGRLPDEAAVRVLRWIRAATLAEDAGIIQKETLAFQFLKAWLLRIQRQRGDDILMQENLNCAIRSPAYHCGRLMAVYAAIQNAAMPDVNVNLAQRYYISASTNPAFVIGKVSGMVQHYIPKLSKGQAVYFDRMLTEIYSNIGDKAIPTALTTEQQTEFALGYYQQRAEIFHQTKIDN